MRNVRGGWGGALSLFARSELAAFLFVACLVFAIGIYKQPFIPATWLDEGFTQQAPLNLLRHGLYAMKSSEGFRILDQPLIANGPGAMLPILLSYSLFGASLFSARLAAVAMMTVAAVAFFALVKTIFGKTHAFVALIFLLAMPSTDGFVELGRTAIGLIPGFAYLMLGGLLWIAAIDKKSAAYALAAGLLLGLASVTKGQYTMLLSIALAVAWVADRLWLRQVKLQLWAAMALTYAGALACWYLFRLYLLGPVQFAEHLAYISQTAHFTVLAFQPQLHAWASLAYLVKAGLLFTWLAGLIYMARLSVQRDPRAGKLIVFAVLSVLWFGWFVIASIGWSRYAFEIHALSAIVIGPALTDAWTTLRSYLGKARPRAPGQFWRLVSMVSVMGACAAALVDGVKQGQVYSRPVNTAPQDFAAYLDQHVAPDAVIESWEWQLDALSDHAYHHPVNLWVDRYTQTLFGGDTAPDAYDFRPFGPDYLIDGPFSKGAGIYKAALQQGCCVLVKQFGQYDLYRVKNAE